MTPKMELSLRKNNQKHVRCSFTHLTQKVTKIATVANLFTSTLRCAVQKEVELCSMMDMLQLLGHIAVSIMYQPIL